MLSVRRVELAPGVEPWLPSPVKALLGVTHVSVPLWLALCHVLFEPLVATGSLLAARVARALCAHRVAGVAGKEKSE